MRTVMIVDDESLVRVGLQSLFDWESNGYRIIGAYKNGLEALDAVRLFCPDVLLTDIKMPVMDGFELIDTVRREHPTLNILILTSVEEYDCMRNALKHGVSDYILKYRIEQHELIRILDSLTYGDPSEDYSIVDNIERGKSLSMGLSSDILMTNDVERDGSDYDILLDLMRPYGDAGMWIVIRLEMDESRSDDVKMKVSRIIIKETIEKYREVIYIGDDAVSIHAILCLSRTCSKAEINGILSDILHPLAASLQDKAGVKTRIGVSIVMEPRDRQQFITMRDSAKNALNQSFYHDTTYYVDDPSSELSKFTEREWSVLRQELKWHIGKCDMDAMASWMVSLETRIRGRIHPKEAIHMYRYIIQQVIDFVIDMRQHGDSCNPTDFHKLMQCADQMEEIHSFQMLSRISQDIIVELTRALAGLCSKKWVKTATHYITENLADTIKLNDVAKLVNFSESYFSMMFHQETGMSFSRYVSCERIKKAIEIMNKTDMSTDEIAVMVGYPNTNYFVKVFKKYTGKTISEFRKN